MGRRLVDASVLIAAARAGALSLLGELLGTVHVPEAVLAEATEPDEPTAAAIEAFVEGEHAAVVPAADEPLEELVELGLGPGEASVIAACRSGDTAVLDDRNARLVARTRGVEVVGTLGLLVAGVEQGRVEPQRGIGMLRGLARGDFRMTVELYDWALERMQAVQDGDGSDP